MNIVYLETLNFDVTILEYSGPFIQMITLWNEPIVTIDVVWE